jgi:hypothetical protein
VGSGTPVVSAVYSSHPSASVPAGTPVQEHSGTLAGGGIGMNEVGVNWAEDGSAWGYDNGRERREKALALEESFEVDL